jgi:hypothetical protein
MSVSPWNASALIQSRADNMRRARNAKYFADTTEGATRSVWRKHMAEKVREARADNRRLILRYRAWSASMFLRKSIGADLRAR